MAGGSLKRAPKRKGIVVCLAAILLIRFGLMCLPGYPPDLQTYKLWALVAGVRGIHTIYDSPEPYDPARLSRQTGPEAKPIDQLQANYDYPPLYAYILAPFGWIYATLAGDPGRDYARSLAFTVLVKIPPLLFDLAIALLLLRRIRARGGLSGWPPSAAALAAFVYFAMPPVLFDSAYWGQPDSIHTFFVLMALFWALDGHAARTGVAIALACLMKPLGFPFAPLVGLALLLRAGWRRTALAACAALGAGLLLFLPYILSGAGPLVWERFTGHFGLMPFTSVNAHNLWWLLGSWRSAAEPILGPLTPTAIGLALFAAACAVVLLAAWRASRKSPAEEPWILAGAAIAFSFFFFSTHMHENHLFAILPFAVILSGRDRSWRAWAWGIALAALLNMAIHDQSLGKILFGNPRESAALRAIAGANAVFVSLLYAGFWFLGARRFRARLTSG